MPELAIDALTPDGTAEGRLFLPDGPGPFPLVVMFMDAFGLRPAMSVMAERLTLNGYAVVQPNLYWRSGGFAPFDPATAFAGAERPRIMALMNAFTPAQAMADARALVSALAPDPRIDGSRIGVVGYCMGGRQAFIASAELSDLVVAAASIHPGGLVTKEPTSPHERVNRIRGELYLGIADQDASCSEAHCDVLRRALDGVGVTYELQVHVGARHGFAMPDSPAYDPASAERQWERVLALFDRKLKGSSAS